MNPYKANFLNSITLIVFGMWGAYPYLFLTIGSPTSLIPLCFGLLLLVLNLGMKQENKIIAHIVVILTFVIFISLFMPLSGSISRADTAATIRIVIMLFTSLLALRSFVKSFINARKS